RQGCGCCHGSTTRRCRWSGQSVTFPGSFMPPSQPQELLMRSLSLFVALAALAAPAGSVLAQDAALQQAVANDHRSASFVARDKYRKPLETLKFLGVQPHHTVVEIAPGGGYWTEILGPYLKDKGTYYTVLNPRTSSERAASAAAAWEKK